MGKSKVISKVGDSVVYNCIVYYDRSKIDALIAFDDENIALTQTSIEQKQAEIDEQLNIVYDAQNKLDIAIGEYSACVNAGNDDCSSTQMTSAQTESSKESAKLGFLKNELRLL